MTPPTTSQPIARVASAAHRVLLSPILTWTDLVRFHDYIGAVLTWVGAEIRAGRSRDDILAMRTALAGFEDFGPFGNPSPREIRTCAYEEITTGT